MIERLAELRRLAEAAKTPGPWWWDGASAIDGPIGTTVLCVEDHPPDAMPEMQAGRLVVAPEDADLISACDPQTVLALVRVSEAAQKALTLLPEMAAYMGERHLYGSEVDLYAIAELLGDALAYFASERVGEA